MAFRYYFDSVLGIVAPSLRHLPAVDVTCMAEVEVKIQMFLDDKPIKSGYRPLCVLCSKPLASISIVKWLLAPNGQTTKKDCQLF